MRHINLVVLGIAVATIAIGCGGSGTANTKKTSQTPSTPTAPKTPMELRAQALSTSSIHLTWIDASNNEAAFVLERMNTALNQGFIVLTSTIAPNVQEYTDTGLMPATKYAYRLKATNAIGDSFTTQEVTARTGTTTNVPIAPSNLTITMLSLTQLKLDWTDNSTNETGFEVEQKAPTGINFSKIATMPQNNTTVTVASLAPDTVYTFRIRATGVFGPSLYTLEVKGRTQRGTPAKTWALETSPTSDFLSGIWGASPNDLWVVTWSSTMLPYTAFPHNTGTGWSLIPVATQYTTSFKAIWGSAANDIWAVGDAIYHYDGTAWTHSFTPPISTEFTAVWGMSSSNVWAAGTDAIYHYDGFTWAINQQFTNSGQFLFYEPRAIHGSTMNDVWMVGASTLVPVNSPVGANGPLIEHNDGTGWSSMTTPPVGVYLNDVWASTQDDVWAIGNAGVVIHYDGSAWSIVGSPYSFTIYALKKLWGVSADNVWAVGDGGIVLYYNGVRWSLMTTPTRDTLYGIWGSPPDNLWAVGTRGVILHYR